MLLDDALATEAARRLAATFAALEPLCDFGELPKTLGPESVIVAAVTAAPPSPDAPRAELMLKGGLVGLRAWLHLATEAAVLDRLRMSPFDARSDLERMTAEHAAHSVGAERVLARHRATFVDPVGHAAWLAGHVEGLVSETLLVQGLLFGLDVKASVSEVFWHDPDTRPDDLVANASLMGELGRAPERPERGPSPAFVDAYRKLERLARL